MRNANKIKTDTIYKYCLTYLFIILSFLFWKGRQTSWRRHPFDIYLINCFRVQVKYLPEQASISLNYKCKEYANLLRFLRIINQLIGYHQTNRTLINFFV